jgi:hypothetical protein
VGSQFDAEHQGGAAPAAGDTQRLSVGDPGGDLHIDVARPAALIQHDAALRACKGLLHTHFQVTRIGLGLLPSRGTAKQAGEEIAEAVEIGESLAAGVPEAL